MPVCRDPERHMHVAMVGVELGVHLVYHQGKRTLYRADCQVVNINQRLSELDNFDCFETHEVSKN